MLPPEHIALRIVQAAYDLESHPAPWLRGLLESGAQVLDQGLGCAAVAVAGQTRGGEPLVSRVVTLGDVSNDLAIRLARASRSLHVAGAHHASDGSTVAALTLSALRYKAPQLRVQVRRAVGCEDVFCLLAVDSNLHGVLILTPTRKRVALSDKARQRWRTVASHVGAADRLRRALGRSNQERLIPVTALPRELTSDARFDAPSAAPLGRSLRDVAVQTDAESAKGAEDRTGQALAVLRGLVDGELSMVDWFVCGGRRFTVARVSDPPHADPRALTPREKQVILRTARGEGRKLVAYDMGIDRTQVTRLLASAMRKLGLENQTELVVKVRCLEPHGLLCDQ